MTDTPDHAGRPVAPRRWPADPRQLTDTTVCPACFARLSAPVCWACGLDLRSARAGELLRLGHAVTDAEDARQSLISVMRAEQQQQRAAEFAAQQAAAQQAAAFVAPEAQHQPPSTAPVSARPDARTHSSVQIALLVVGVSLVSVAAIFFLTVAWVLTGLAVRSTIVAGATVAALVIAAVLRRRRLTATAEGIGTLGVVLVLLDLWAARANDLFGAAGADALSYWGFGLLACTAVFVIVHVSSRLRTAGAAALMLPPLAIGMLVGDATVDLDAGAQITAASLAAAVATALVVATRTSGPSWWPVVNRSAERVALYAMLYAALGIATISAGFASPDAAWAPIGWYSAVTIVAAAHTALALRTTARPALGGWLATVAVFALCLVAPVIAGRAHNGTALVTTPTLVAVLLALGLETVTRSATARPAIVRAATGVATITARVIAGCWLIVTVSAAAAPLAQALIHGVTMTHTPSLQLAAVSGWALLTLAGVGALSAGCWTMIGRARRRLVPLSWYTAGLLILAVPYLPGLPAMLAGFVMLTAVGCVLSIAVMRHGDARRAPAGPALALMIGAQAAAFIAGFASSSTWWIGAVSAVLALYASRFIVRGAERAVARPILAGSAAALTLLVAGVAPWALSLSRTPSVRASLDNVIGGITLGVAVLVVVTALPWRRFLRPAERRAVLWTAAPFSLLFVYPALQIVHRPPIEVAPVLQPEPIGGIVRTCLLLVALVLWIALPRNRRGLRWERRAAAAALTPAIAVLATLIARAAGATDAGIAAAVAGSGLLGFGIGMLLGTVTMNATSRARRAPHLSRWVGIRTALDGGAAAVMAVAVAFGVGSARPGVWFVLVLCSLGLLLAAITSDGLFASTSARRHLAWCSLALGVVALWMRLSATHVDLLEAYVLPPAVALVVLAALLHRFGAAWPRAANRLGVAALLFAGLLIAAIPLSFASTSGPLLRALIVGACGAAVMLSAAARRTATSRWYLIGAGVPGALAVLLVGVGRAGHVAAGPAAPPPAFDLWLGCTGAAFCAAGALVIVQLTRSAVAPVAGTTDQPTVRDASVLRIGVAPVLIAIGLLVGLGPIALRSPDVSVLRAVLVLAVAGVLAVCAAVLQAQRDWRVTSWVALAITLSTACIAAGGRLGALFGVDGPPDGRIEAWLAPTAALLAVVAVVVTARRNRTSTPFAVDVVAASLLIIGVCGVLTIELAALTFTPLTIARVLVLSWGLAAVHAIAFFVGRPPLTPLVAWVALAAGAVAAVVGAPQLSPTPFELATVPIAAALLITGGLHMMRTPTARSWPWLGGGIAALLLPSLIVGFWDAPLWRIVALGVVAVGAILIGLVMRLQAPFVIGCAVALVHALVQLWPWIAAAYQATQWWLWVGLGGALLIAIAARYERRMRDIRTAVLRISAMR